MHYDYKFQTLNKNYKFLSEPSSNSSQSYVTSLSPSGDTGVWSVLPKLFLITGLPICPSQGWGALLCSCLVPLDSSLGSRVDMGSVSSAHLPQSKRGPLTLFQNQQLHITGVDFSLHDALSSPLGSKHMRTRTLCSLLDIWS